MSTRTKKTLVIAAASGITALAVGCSKGNDKQTAHPPFLVDIEVTNGVQKAAPDVELAAHGQKVATTDSAGRARLSVQGSEGDNVELTVKCPAGFQSPSAPLVVPLRRFSCENCAPRFSAVCAPLVRTVVVGIRAENGANLPVIRFGKEIGRTDDAGAAHVILAVKAGEQVTLSLDTTSDAKLPRRRPDNPTLTFVAKDADDFVTLEQRFEIEKPKSTAKPSAPRPNGPTRI